MSKTVAPLLSFGASGQIAKTQVYASWKGRAYARRYVIPANPRSTAQTETRNTFKFLNAVWRYMPASAIGAWDLLAKNNRVVNRNSWIAQNLSILLSASNLDDLTMSPAAGGGLPSGGSTFTAGATKITVATTAPALPAGWTITAMHCMAIKDQDPQTGTSYVVSAASDNTSPYSIDITGLTTGDIYQVGAWLEYVNAAGNTVYGVNDRGTATPT